MMAIEFLLGIPLEMETKIVREGIDGDFMHRSSTLDFDEDTNFGSQRSLIVDDDHTLSAENFSYVSSNSVDGSYSTTQSTSRWWEKIISKDKSFLKVNSERAKLRDLKKREMELLEAPNQSSKQRHMRPKDDEGISYYNHSNRRNFKVPPSSLIHALMDRNQNITSGRRQLDGRDDVTEVRIPQEAEFQTEQKTRHVVVVREAMVREWEKRVLYGLLNTQVGTSQSTSVNEKRGLLDGRIFFSSQRSYPLQVFSVIKYEPEREEALRKRKTLEESGRGGMEYILPVRLLLTDMILGYVHSLRIRFIVRFLVRNLTGEGFHTGLYLYDAKKRKINHLIDTFART